MHETSRTAWRRSRSRVVALVSVFMLTGRTLAGDGDVRACTAVYGHGPGLVRVATGAPGELGLLAMLAEHFAAGWPARVCWRKAGTGEALDLLRSGVVDIVLGHAPEAEQRVLDDGVASARVPFAANEFLLVGPPGDPAGIRTAATAVEAYRRIAATAAPFISRDDGSGTHRRELALWRQAGVEPRGDWYVRIGGYMQEALREADARGGYFMPDSSTWGAVAPRYPGLATLLAGDPALLNPYHALLGARAGADARALVDFIASDGAQRLIGSFGLERFGRQLYLGATHVRPGITSPPPR